MDNTTVTSMSTSPQPVTGQSLFWAVITLALGAMSQSSIVADHFLDADSNAEGVLVPYASSPLHCLVDALFESIVLSRYLLKVVGILKPISKGSPSCEPSMSPTVDEPRTEAPTRQLIAARSVLFALAIVPQAVKVFSMCGIPVTQVIAGCFLATIFTRLIHTLVGERLKDEAQIVYHYRQSIAESKLQFESRCLIIHAPLSALAWYHISQKPTLFQTEHITPVLRLLDHSGVIFALFFGLHIIWCLAILLNQWRVRDWWPLPFSPMAVIMPLLHTRLYLNYLVDGSHGPTDAMTYFWTYMLMSSTLGLSYVFASLFALSAGRAVDGRKLDDEECDNRSATIVDQGTSQPTASCQTVRAPPSNPPSIDTVPQDSSARGVRVASDPAPELPAIIPSKDDELHQNEVADERRLPPLDPFHIDAFPSTSNTHQVEAVSDPAPVSPAMTACEDNEYDRNEAPDQEKLPMPPADGSRIPFVEAVLFAAQSIHTKIPSEVTKAISSLHPVDQMSILAWKDVVFINLVLFRAFLSNQSDTRSSRAIPNDYRGWTYCTWIYASIVFADFRRQIPEAFRVTWTGTSEAEKSRSLPLKMKACTTLLLWILIWLVIKLVLFLVFAIASFFDYSALNNFLGTFRTRYDDSVRWTTFAIFNFVTAALYYLLVFDGTGTLNPKWTSWLGK